MDAVVMIDTGTEFILLVILTSLALYGLLLMICDALVWLQKKLQDRED